MTPTPEEVLAKYEMMEFNIRNSTHPQVSAVQLAFIETRWALDASQKQSEEYARLWHRDAERVRELAEAIAHLLAWAGQSQSVLTSRQVADAVMGMCQDALRGPESPA
jgi:hypothetical protein